jgi:hypothetical protein
LIQEIAQSESEGMHVNDIQAIRRVLELQEHYSRHNSAPMRERGYLIRHHLPRIFAEFLNELAQISEVDDLAVEGRDGTGLKAEIPWVRLFSKRLSPTAQHGWYVVLLFSRSGSSVFLALQHASTQSVSRDKRRKAVFRPRPQSEVAKLKEIAYETLPHDLFDRVGLRHSIALGSEGVLAKAYESTTICAYEYPADALPDSLSLRQNLQELLVNLSLLYAGPK